jgi:hypothetical protein
VSGADEGQFKWFRASLDPYGVGARVPVIAQVAPATKAWHIVAQTDDEQLAARATQLLNAASRRA